jgi:hypothetical protein
VTVRGTATANDEIGVHIDATEGAVVMHVTKLSGIVNSITPGQVDIDLSSLGGRRPEIYDFTCTGGCEPMTDADPDNYEVSTGNLLLDATAAGQPVAAWGFVNEYMGAPPDTRQHERGHRRASLHQAGHGVDRSDLARYEHADRAA